MCLHIRFISFRITSFYLTGSGINCFGKNTGAAIITFMDLVK